MRDTDHPYGFAAFTVDPGRFPGDTTRMHVTYYNVNKPDGDLSVFENFTLHRKRSDGRLPPGPAHRAPRTRHHPHPSRRRTTRTAVRGVRRVVQK
ncbi:MAG TPA: hypothetical protein VGL02_26930 [Streptomyces sp.]